MKVNRLGKFIYDKGYRSLEEFVTVNKIDLNVRTLYGWCTSYTSSPSEGNMYAVTKIAEAYDMKKSAILDMIASPVAFEVDLAKDGYGKKPKEVVKEVSKTEIDRSQYNPLQLLRMDRGLTQQELANIVGAVNKQEITDIEVGSRRNFHDSKTLTNYLELFDISFSWFQDTMNQIYSEHKAKKRENERKLREKRKAEAEQVKIDNFDEDIEIMEIKKDNTQVASLYDEVMRLLYGKVDFATYNKVATILSVAYKEANK